MEAYHIEQFGLEHLKPVAYVAQTPGFGHIRLSMRAVSLNYRDLMMVRGQYNPRQPLPLIPCSDGVGIVEEVGPGVDQWAVGDRVIPVFAQSWMSGQLTDEKARGTLGGPLDGTLRPTMVLSAEGVVRAPEHMSDAEAATLPCAGLTAWSALMTQGALRAGQTVLLQGTGGVSLFALQIAKAAGARVIMTSSREDKLARASSLGADELINYKEDTSWGKTARKMTGGRGVDHVVEVGGAGTLAQSLKAVRTGGQISLIGVLSGAAQPLNIIPILMRNIRMQGIFVGHKEGLEHMIEAMTHHQIRPVVDSVFGWSDVGLAFEHMAQGKHFGKICITCQDE